MTPVSDDTGTRRATSAILGTLARWSLGLLIPTLLGLLINTMHEVWTLKAKVEANEKEIDGHTNWMKSQSADIKSVVKTVDKLEVRVEHLERN